MTGCTLIGCQQRPRVPALPGLVAIQSPSIFCLGRGVLCGNQRRGSGSGGRLKIGTLMHRAGRFQPRHLISTRARVPATGRAAKAVA